MYKLPHHRRRHTGVAVAAALRLARVPLAVMALGCFGLAAAASPADVVVTNAWARPTMPGQTVRLAPSGMHLMLLQLKKPLRAGDSIALDLTVVDKAGGPHIVHVIAPVMTTPLQQGTP